MLFGGRGDGGAAVRSRYIALALVSTVCMSVGLFAGLLHDDGTIAEGVFVEGLPLVGLTAAEAEQALAEAFDRQMPSHLALRLRERAWPLENGAIGRRARYDLAAAKAYAMGREGNWLARAEARLDLAHRGLNLRLPVDLDRAALEQSIAALAAEIDREPSNARVVGIYGEQLYFAAEQDGLKLDVAGSLAAAAVTSFPPPATVELLVERVEPKVKVAELRDGLTTRLGEHTTSMAHGYYGAQRRNRSHNVRLCLARMNGTVLAPGDSFSFNDRLGERRSEDGFRSSYVFRRKPDGTVEERWETGGGICQLATTLFNAVLYANLRVTERQNHSKPVHYARLGRDATVYFGVVDLRFVNNLSHPVMLWGELDDELDLTITVWGSESDDVDVELESAGWYGARGPGGDLWHTVRAKDGTLLVPRTHLFGSSYRSN